MNYKELKTKSANEIKELLKELKAKSHDLSVKMKLNQVKNTKELTSLKKDIARILTFLNNN